MRSEIHKKNQYSRLFKHIIAWTGILFVSIVFVVSRSQTVNAGLFSLLNGMFGADQASADITQAPSMGNSQTMVLLSAAANPNPDTNNLSEVAPLDGNVLSPEIASTNSASSSEALNTEISSYVVREGDTLSLIAKMFDVSVNTIVWANGLGGSKSTLIVGQTLVILPVSGIKYTVVKGDTVSGIVKKYKADIDEVSRYNDIAPSSPLAIGQVIIIPDAELAAPSSGSSVASSGSLPSYSGYYIRPLAYGYRSQGIHGHNAVDLAGILIGAPIRAAADGTIIISRINGGWNGAYGNYIVISHPNGTQTLYAHMSPGSVGVVALGQHVDQGQTIGYVGMTGRTTGPHLHFEIRGARNPF